MNKAYIKRKFNEEIKYLKDAVKNSKNPFHFFTLSTINKNLPESRTIVLRNVVKNPFKLFFNTDIRSNKISQLKNNPTASILFYDNQRKIQLRLKVNAVLHVNNKLSKSIWDKTPLQSRKCYMAPYIPSSKLNSWHPNIPVEYLKKDPEKKDSERGYKNFCSVELIVETADIIELHHDGHIRFKLDLVKDKSNFIAA